MSVRRIRRVASAVTVAALSGLIFTSPSSAQVASIDPQTGELGEARAATTIMLDPLYWSQRAAGEEVATVPLDGPAGGVTMSQPEIIWNVVVAHVAPDGTLATSCDGGAPGAPR